MKHIWSIICEKSSIDFETNLLSIFSCLEELKLVIDETQVSKTEKLIIPVNFQIVSFWSIENFSQDSSLEIKGELLDPQGTVLNEFQNTLQIKAGVKRFRNRTNVQGLPVTKSGRYYFRISQKDKNKFIVVANLPLDIDLSYKLLENKVVQN